MPTPGPHQTSSPWAARGILFVILAIAAGLRCGHLESAAIDHFDEGVYSSGRWFAQTPDGHYPLRHFYAPPLLPGLVDVSIDFAGPRLGPLLPAMLFGVLSVLVVWRMLSDWIGVDAAIAGSLLLATNDFHAVYSRFALTDVVMGFWFLLAVWQGTAACLHGGPGRILLAGLAAGLCWWTKYNGWLPLATLLSGLTGWKLIGPFLARHRDLPANFFRPPFGRLLVRWLALTAVAVAVWSPVYFQLPNGYAEIAANHAGYFRGPTKWLPTAAEQLENHQLLTGFFTLAGIFGTIVAVAFFTKFVDPRFTWNVTGPEGRAIPEVQRVRRRLVSGGILLTLIAAVAGGAAVLMILAAGGLLGTFRWSIRHLRLAEPSPSTDTADDRKEHSQADSPAIRTAADVQSNRQRPHNFEPCWWVLLAWLTSLTLVTPLYQPYPRITIPWLLAAVLCAGTGVAWWTRALRNQLLSRAESQTLKKQSSLGGGILPLMLTATIVILGISRSQHFKTVPFQIPAWERRDSLQQLASDIAAFTADSPATSNSEPMALVFGEPALLFHLNANGVPATPIASLNVWRTLPPRLHDSALLVIGPHARSTNDFDSDWKSAAPISREVLTAETRPSTVVSLNDATTRARLLQGHIVRHTFHVYRRR